MPAKKQTYYEKLKDPRWQKKRLEILQEHDFTCDICYDYESTLHVHHKEYFKGKEPWEYDNNQLSVLCESCHEDNHDSKDLFKYISSILDFDGPKDRSAIAFILAGYIDLDYDLAISKSDFEDCAFSRCFYDIGINLSNSNFDMRSYIKMYENKNGKN